ncbi:hypothetical protein M3J09_010734 [Ascochyta lentis]
MVMVDSCVIHLAALLHDPTLSYAMLGAKRLLIL